MSIKAILFDLDNTLIDFIGMKRVATQAAAEAMVDAGLKADKDELSSDLFDFYLDYDIEADNAFQMFLEARIGRIDFRILAAAINAYLREKAINLKPYPGVSATLVEIRRLGYKLAIVTNGRRLKAAMRLNAAGLDGYFDVVVGWEDTGKKKPDPEPFLLATNVLGVKPTECLMVGDWPEIDLAGAVSLGMKTCWAKYGNAEKKANSDYIINHFDELRNLLKENGIS
jgi:putative hydrolase of the HAD superfamily